jgi:hypothetical protein
MDCPGKVFGSFQFALDERSIDDRFRGDVRQFTFLPGFHLLSHRLEVALHSVYSNRAAVDEGERLRVFGKNRGERAGYNVSRFGSSEYSISKKPICGPLGPTSFNFRVARYLPANRKASVRVRLPMVSRIQIQIA